MLTPEHIAAGSDDLHQARIRIHYQPLVSIRKRCVVGMEALARGIDLRSGALVPIDRLFAEARHAGYALDLDRLCRDAGCASFRMLHRANPSLLLFLNLDAAIIDRGVVGSNVLRDQVERYGLTPGSVVIEIIESRVRDITALRQFVTTYRDYGFLIALDDVGAGYSNLDRISLIKPDILKIDSSLVRNIDQEYYRQVVVKSLTGLAKSIGSLVVAEGIETANEAVMALELGADLLQGFYFAPPQESDAVLLPAVQARIDAIASHFRTAMIARVATLKDQHQQFDRMLSRLVSVASATDDVSQEGVLRQLIAAHPVLECLYLLDGRGIQVSETVSRADAPPPANAIFSPARHGADHTYKEYYYLLVGTGADKFVTEPYISLATGKPCITISVPFTDAMQQSRILCMDINPNR